MRTYAGPVLWGLGIGLASILLIESIGWGQIFKPKAAATVNGEVIPLEEVDAIIKSRGPQITPPTSAQQRQHRLEVLSGLIDEMLVRQFLKESGVKINEAEVDKSIAALEASLKTQNKTMTEFLRESNQTEAQVRAGIVQMLQLAKYTKENTKEEDLKKYYETNKDFFDKSTVRVSHIVLKVGIAAKEEERQEARKKLQAVREQILSGKKDFAEAAKEISHCPSAPKGGDIGYIYRKWQVDEGFAVTAFQLKVNEVSDLIETDFGIHLIKVTERKMGTASKYEMCVEDVRDCYTEELRQNMLAKLRQKAKIEISLP